MREIVLFVQDYSNVIRKHSERSDGTCTAPVHYELFGWSNISGRSFVVWSGESLDTIKGKQNTVLLQKSSDRVRVTAMDTEKVSTFDNDNLINLLHYTHTLIMGWDVPKKKRNS